MISDDLTPLLAGKDLDALTLRQGVVVAFDQSSGANTVDIAGVVMTDLPVLSSSESLEFAPGDVVVVLAWKSAWFILGRVVVAGGVLAPSAVVARVMGAGETNFALTTGAVQRAVGTLAVPPWAGRISIHAQANLTVRNSTAVALAWAEVQVLTYLAVGGVAYTSVPATSYANASDSTVRSVAVTPGSVAAVTVSANVRASAALIADPNTRLTTSATVTFTRD